MDKNQIFDIKVKTGEVTSDATEEELSNGKGEDE